ncbi:MAG: hypothetical protein AB1714_16805 [Acidobacteriota bacterium]
MFAQFVIRRLPNRASWNVAIRFVLSASLVVLGNKVQAGSQQVPAWRDVGPDGGNITDLAIAPSRPNILYASAGTFYESVDSAATWRILPATAGTVYDQLVVDPAVATTVYALHDAALYKSTNGGRGWNRLLSEGHFGKSRVSCFAVSPSSSSTMYAATSWDCVVRSTDGGTTWSRTRSFENDGWVGTIAIDPRNPDVAYAGTGDPNIFKTSDGGATWVASDRGLPARIYGVGGICISPSNPDVVYVGVCSHGLFKSTNAGARWEFAGEFPDERSYQVPRLTVDPASPDILYAATEDGAYVTTTSGKKWTRISGLPADSVRRIVADPTNSDLLYAATISGVLQSTDRGTTWSTANAGIKEWQVDALAVDPSRPGVVYIGTAAGVFKTTDGGGSWNSSIGKCSKLTRLRSITIDPSDPDVVYACGGSGTFKSTDSGATWKQMPRAVDLIAVDPQTPTTLYASIYEQVFKSIDGGHSWKSSVTFSGGTVSHIEIDPAMPTTVYAAREDGVCAAKSTDGGSTWTCMLVVGTESWDLSWGLALDPGSPSTVYACEGRTSKKLWKSTDRGESWNTIMKGRAVSCLLVSPTASNVLYAGTQGQGVYRSTNGGKTWLPMSRGLGRPASRYVRALASSSAEPNVVYAATDTGVFRVEDAR